MISIKKICIILFFSCFVIVNAKPIPSFVLEDTRVIAFRTTSDNVKCYAEPHSQRVSTRLESGLYLASMTNQERGINHYWANYGIEDNWLKVRYEDCWVKLDSKNISFQEEYPTTKLFTCFNEDPSENEKINEEIELYYDFNTSSYEVLFNDISDFPTTLKFSKKVSFVKKESRRQMASWYFKNSENTYHFVSSRDTERYVTTSQDLANSDHWVRLFHRIIIYDKKGRKVRTMECKFNLYQRVMYPNTNY